MALKVETGIPYGNACDVSISVEGRMPVVSFAAHPHGGPECLWFCFRLIQTRPVKNPSGKVKLVLKHAQNMLGVADGRKLRPVIKTVKGEWRRMEPGVTKEFPDGRSQVEWVIDAPSLYADIAFCYPYGQPELETLLRETHNYWQADTIGISQGGRPLVRLSNSPGQPGSQRPGLYLVARQHSGETPGSWVLDGFLRRIAELGKDAPLVWAVPLSNIDGVEQGDYGKDNFPYDLNRAWALPPMRHETLVIQRDMQRWKKRCQPILGLDFHAPGASEAEGIYAYVHIPKKNPEYYQRQEELAAYIATALKEYAAKNFLRPVTYASRWESPMFTDYCRDTLWVCALGIEIPYAMAGEVLFTRERYREAGARIVEGIMKKYRGVSE